MTLKTSQIVFKNILEWIGYDMEYGQLNDDHLIMNICMMELKNINATIRSRN